MPSSRYLTLRLDVALFLSLALVLVAITATRILTSLYLRTPATAPEVAPAVMSIRRCNDIMEARRLMTDTQLRARWPGGETSPVQWEVRVIDIRADGQGGSGMEVHFACPDSGKLQMAGTFHTTASALGHRGGLDLNRGDIITIRGHLHRDIEGWGASLSELVVLSNPLHPPQGRL